MEVRYEYRTVNHNGKWYAERLKRAGVWNVLGEFDSKEKADEAIEKDKEVLDADF